MEDDGDGMCSRPRRQRAPAMSTPRMTRTDPSFDEVEGLFPGYEIVRLVSAGGDGAVYEAVQRSLDRRVAIRILPRELTARGAFRKRFMDEVRAMALLSHPNLVGVHDFGEVDGLLFIIMEHVAGRPLNHYVSEDVLEPREAARVVAEAAMGIAHAHQNGIIHRDVKPSNILLDRHGHPRIGGFGLAGPLQTEAAEGDGVVTPGYAAPEVIANPGSVDHRVDVFSLGVMLHELLTGMLPGEDRRPSAVDEGCDPWFDELVCKATEPDPLDRHQTAVEFAADLESIIVAIDAAERAAARQPGARASAVGWAVMAACTALMLLAGFVFREDIFPGDSGRVVEADPLPDVTPVELPGMADSRVPSADPVPAPLPVPDPVPSDDPFARGLAGPFPDPAGAAGGAIPAAPRAGSGIPAVVRELPDGSRLVHWGGATSEWHRAGEGLTGYRVTGLDIWNHYDSGVFKAVEWEGDGVFTLKVDELEEADPPAKAGLMIRGSLEDDSANVFLTLTSAGATAFSVRPLNGAATHFVGFSAHSHAYLRLVREGARISAMVSNDGEEWTGFGTPVTLEQIGASVHAGFAACSRTVPGERPLAGTTGPLMAATLTGHAEVVMAEDEGTLPGPDDEDMGAVEITVTEMPDGTRLVHFGGGRSEWTDAGNGGLDFSIAPAGLLEPGEAVVLRCIEWNGDGVFTLQFGGLDEEATSFSAGLMIRAGLEDSSPFVFLSLDHSEGTVFAVGGGDSEGTRAVARVDRMFRLMRMTREHDRIVASVSRDGLNWTRIGEPTALGSLPDSVQVGFAATVRGLEGENRLTGWVSPVIAARDEDEFGSAVQAISQAREAISQRCARELDDYLGRGRANVRRFERDMRQVINRLPSPQARQSALNRLSAMVEQAENNHNRLPRRLGEEIGSIAGAEQVLAEGLRSQRQNDAGLVEYFERHTATYVGGLESRMNALREQGEDVAADLLMLELQRCRTDPAYFPRLISEAYPVASGW